MRSGPLVGSVNFSEKLGLREEFSTVHGSASRIAQGPTTVNQMWSWFRSRYLSRRWSLRLSLPRLTMLSSNLPYMFQFSRRPWGVRWSEFRSSGIYGGASSPPRNSWTDLCEHLKELDSDLSYGTGQTTQQADSLEATIHKELP